MSMRKVVEVKRHNNLTGRVVWRMVLECGHEQSRPAREGAASPTRVKCGRCVAGAPPAPTVVGPK